MAVLGRTAKAAAVAKGLKAAPPAAKAGIKTGRPIVKRKARKQLDEAGDAIALTLATYVPRAARQLGLKPPKRKRTTPRVLAGVLIGAAGVYLFEPDQGPKHRKRLAKLVG
jgi:hypothetical protein